MRNLIRMSAVMLALVCTVAVMAGTQELQSPANGQSQGYIVINPSCGDGYITAEVYETCDPPGGAWGPNDNVCRDDCTYCGDGILDEGEACDDGDSDDFDECANDCTVGPECGDGYIDAATGETCDPPGMPAPNGNDCRNDCTYCGDGYQDEGEECDDGDSDDYDECSNSCTVPVGGEGCTPGYWKNKLFAWEMTAYSPDMLVGNVFDLPEGFESLHAATLHEALSWNSGGDPEEEALNKARNLIKHAVASLLNATHTGVGFSWMAGDIIDAVNDALVGGDPGYMDDLHYVFDDANNAGCPLSGRPPRANIDNAQYLRRGVQSRSILRPDNGPIDLQRY